MSIKNEPETRMPDQKTINLWMQDVKETMAVFAKHIETTKAVEIMLDQSAGNAKQLLQHANAIVDEHIRKLAKAYEMTKQDD